MEKKYKFTAKDLLLSVEELNQNGVEKIMTITNKIDSTSLEISKLTMGVLVRKGIRKGYPKPDDQDRYQNEYAKINGLTFKPET
jgi:hypothetical protein